MNVHIGNEGRGIFPSMPPRHFCALRRWILVCMLLCPYLSSPHSVSSPPPRGDIPRFYYILTSSTQQHVVLREREMWLLVGWDWLGQCVTKLLSPSAPSRVLSSLSFSLSLILSFPLNLFLSPLKGSLSFSFFLPLRGSLFPSLTHSLFLYSTFLSLSIFLSPLKGSLSLFLSLSHTLSLYVMCPFERRLAECPAPESVREMEIVCG